MNCRLFVIVALPLLLTAVGCKKNPCPEGSYVNETHKFCLKLPPGITFNKEEDRPNWKLIDFLNKEKNTPFMNVTIYKDPSQFAGQKAYIEGTAKNPGDKTIVNTGKAEGAEDGAFTLFTFKGGFTSQLDYVVKSEGRVAGCYTNAKPEFALTILESCKTLRLLK